MFALVKALLILFCIGAVILGAYQAIRPEVVAMWGTRWRYNNAEPTDFYLFWMRVGGVAAVIVGMIMFFKMIAL